MIWNTTYLQCVRGVGPLWTLMAMKKKKKKKKTTMSTWQGCGGDAAGMTSRHVTRRQATPRGARRSRARVAEPFGLEIDDAQKREKNGRPWRWEFILFFSRGLWVKKDMLCNYIHIYVVSVLGLSICVWEFILFFSRGYESKGYMLCIHMFLCLSIYLSVCGPDNNNNNNNNNNKQIKRASPIPRDG